MGATLAQGTVLQGRYKVVNKITTGGQSNIYRIIEVGGSEQELALKEMFEMPMTPQDEAQVCEQFHQQTRILSSLSHPNLLKIITSLSKHGKNYLVMEFIHGSTLEDILHSTPGFLEERQVINWAIQLCDALDYLHSQENPIIFRDIKPANIMLDKMGVIKLIDFGIARIFNPLKRTDTLKMGTMGYAPPEQYKGRGQTDERSDIYTLGATMYHLLTKKDPQDEPPFAFSQTMPRDLRPDLSADIEKVVMKAVEYDRNNRQSSAREFKAELLACSAPVVSPSRSSAAANAISTIELQARVRDSKPSAPPISIRKQANVPPLQIPTSAAPQDTSHVGGNIIVRGFVWIYSIIAGVILGAISCPLIVAFSLIMGALKGIVIGAFIGGAGILISRKLVDIHGMFARTETWILIGFAVAVISAIVNPMANIIRSHRTFTLYKQYIRHDHGRYAAVLGSLVALSAIAYPVVKHIDEVTPLVIRYMEYVWHFLVSHV